MRSRKPLWAGIVLAAIFSSVTHGQQELLTSADLAGFDNPRADARIAYGEDPLQFGELRLPPTPGPHPVAVFVHGGCWLSQFDIVHSNKLSAALAKAGIATWSLEYRRVGDTGGGWPTTYRDVGDGADYLRRIADTHELDLDRVILMGHSAGAHFALWLAARTEIPSGSALSFDKPLTVRGVLALAPAPDLAYLHEQQVCGHVIDKLMGGAPATYPERYRVASAMDLALSDTPQILIIGKRDNAWAPVGMRYLQRSLERGDRVRLIEAPESGHFEMIDPDSSTWPLVLGAAQGMLGLTLIEGSDQ